MEQEINSRYAGLISIEHRIDELYRAAAKIMGLSDSAFTIMYGLNSLLHRRRDLRFCHR